MTGRRGDTTWSLGLAVVIALTYVTLAVMCIAAGYLVGRLLL